MFNILEAPASTATARMPRLLGVFPQWGQRHSTSAALYLIQVLQVGHGGSDVVHTRRTPGKWSRNTSDGPALDRIVSPGFGGQRSISSANMISLVFMHHLLSDRIRESLSRYIDTAAASVKTKARPAIHARLPAVPRITVCTLSVKSTVEAIATADTPRTRACTISGHPCYSIFSKRPRRPRPRAFLACLACSRNGGNAIRRRRRCTSSRCCKSGMVAPTSSILAGICGSAAPAMGGPFRSVSYHPGSGANGRSTLPT